MEHAVMDATAMDCLPESCFDLVIDKALLDCLLCANDSGKLAAKLLRHVSERCQPCAYKLLKLHASYRSLLSLRGKAACKLSAAPYFTDNDSAIVKAYHMQQHTSLAYQDRVLLHMYTCIVVHCAVLSGETSA
jgi:hypothetical protein